MNTVTVKQTSKLMIVAHPDDEALFGGQELVQTSKWLVICLTNGNHTKRREQFLNAMESLSLQSEIWNYPDQPGLSKQKSLAQQLWKPFIEEIKERLSNVLAHQSFSQVITHNCSGEYGHPHHQITHYLVQDIVPPEKLFCFALGAKINQEILDKKLALLSFYNEQFSPQELIKYSSWITQATIKSLV